MKRLLEPLVWALVLLAPVAPFVPMASAATNYVAQGGQTPAPPYTSWATAASNIQDAINQAIAGDTVLVSNGVYEAGGLTNFPTGTLLTNRVAIWKAITVRSLNNDPTNTIIKGDWDPATNGPAAVRCVYMTNGSTLIGFTLTNGATLTTGSATNQYGGGVYCQSTNTVISNCVLTGNSANSVGGGAFYGTLFNCSLTRNSATYAGGTYVSTLFNCTLNYNSAYYSGGGSYGGVLTDCTLSYNSAQYGGGSVAGYLNNCTLTGNSAGTDGGGAYGGTLTNCALTGNSATNKGGGAYANWGQILYNCTLTSNSAGVAGGGVSSYTGVYFTTLSNCTLTGNSTLGNGGGAWYYSKLYNCTLIGNSAGTFGGGAIYCTLYNCTIVSNSAGGSGGGVSYASTLYNCTLVGNSAGTSGGGVGGVDGSTLYNCTIVGNSAGGSGGGVNAGTLYNCISWGNDKVDVPGTFMYSCGVGYTNGGSVSGNITNNPLFTDPGSGYGTNHVAGNYHLRNVSPPLNAGTNFSWIIDSTDVRSKDLDGSRRIDRFSGQVDMGCYELMPRGTMFIMK